MTALTFVSSYQPRRPLALATAALLTVRAALSIAVELDLFDAARSHPVAVASLLAWLATPLAFLAWLAGVYRNLPALGSRTKATAAWAVGRWFIPVVNLWHGYVALRTAWIESLPEPGRRPTRLIGWWWGLFLLGSLRFAVADVELLALPRLSLEILAAGLCVSMVLELDARQRDQHEELVARQKFAPTPTPTPWPSPAPPRR